MLFRWWMTALVLAAALPCAAQFDSGSDGSDGALTVAADEDVVIDLSLAATAAFDTPSPVSGQGVYDASIWAVVFKYTTVDIGMNGTVTFLPHPSGAPVIWLTTGDVNIAGTVSVNGETGLPYVTTPGDYAQPGPGGFAGGVRQSILGNASRGFGPGGGATGSNGPGGGGGFGTVGEPGGSGCGTCGAGGGSYGSMRIVPMIGGSGGGGGNRATAQNGDGGAGGGAILVASSTQITLAATGSITANGGHGGIGSGSLSGGGGGSGGSIRLIANTISGDGELQAVGGVGGVPNGGPGGNGRIRVDADSIMLTDGGNPAWTTDLIFLPVFSPSNAPTLTATMVDSISLPADPEAGILTSDAEVASPSAVTLQIEATNIPAGTTVTVTAIPARGMAVTATSTPLVGNEVLSTATATLTLPPGRLEVQLRANWTP